MSAARDASPSEIPTDADFLARARSLVPTLAAREAEATAARNVPAETIEDLTGRLNRGSAC